ncbi:LysR family transcriptional regulator [Herbaspirillum autotrophicum]|uniref:LysR family transcriptional regulator n=1 Tax=Herbaspirillum autotrophicum TaxID=180195 RepID=UPI0009FB4595|nr:LysR family transcriptional regulator [Herbaspirillum autotrophicum]
MNMDLNRNRMRYFEAVKEHKSIRRAAEQLNAKPSVITRQIQTLENEIGTELFERNHKGMIPTEAAYFLTEFWLSCLAQKENLDDQLRTLREIQHGHIQISLCEDVAESFLNEALSEFIHLYPKVEIVANVRATNAIIGNVVENVAHIGIAYNPPMCADIDTHASSRHCIVAAMRPGHALAQRTGPISLQDAIEYPCGLMPTSYGLGQLVQNIACAEALTIKAAFTSNTLLMLKQYAKASDGISFLTDFSVRREIAAGELVAIPLAHPLLNNQHVKVLVKAKRPLTRAVQELLTHIKQRMTVFNDAGFD